MSKTIIMAAHGHDDPTRDALALAVALARACGSNLVLAGIWASPLGAGDAVYERLVREPLSHELRELRDDVPDDVPCRIHVAGSTSVARGLHRAAELEGAELLVVGPTHLGPIARAGRGDIAVSLLYDAPCPVAVAPQGRREHLGQPLGALVVGWHGAAEDRDALETAVAIAQGSGSIVHIVTVIELPFTYALDPAVDAVTLGHWVHMEAERARQELHRAREIVGDRVALETHILEGDPVGRLADVCPTDGLLIVGSRGHGVLRRLVLGSTSTGLVRAADKPVLVVPHAATLAVAPTVGRA